MSTPALKRIYQLPSLTTPITQLAGGYLVWDVPLGPVAGGYKSYKGTAEELAAYLRSQGLLAGETAALVKTDITTGTLTYEAPKNLVPADVLALGFAITTATGTTHALLVNVTSVYDSATGELLITLPPGTDPTDVLSVHLYRPGPVQEQMLAADLNPFGGGGSQFLTGTYTIKPADVTNPASAITIPVAGALAFGTVGVAVPGVSGQDILTPNSDYTSTPGQLTISAGLNPALAAGNEVHYAYLTGVVQAGVTPAQLAAVATTLPVTTTRTADYTLQLSDAGCLVPMASSAAVTVTVPANADVAFPVGTTLYVAQDGSGQVAAAAAQGVVIRVATGYGLKVPGQWLDVSLHKRDTNTWILKGGIA